MRVAMFMPGLGSRALGWGVHRDFARAVRDLGCRFDLVTTGTRDRSDDDVTVLGTASHWRSLGRWSAPLTRAPGVIPSAAALAGYLQREGDAIDVLHVEVAYPHGVAAVLAARAVDWTRPLVLTPMGEDTLILEEAKYGFRRYAVPRAAVSWALSQASCIRCISPLLAQRIAVIAPRTPRQVVPLNVSDQAAAASCEPAAKRADRRRRARSACEETWLPGGRRVILALGRLHPFKGIDTLVRALTDVPDAILVVAGPSLTVRSYGDTADRLRALAGDLGVADRVRIVGPVAAERALDLLAAVDVVAVPSLLESLNKVCVEAAAVGTPFVVTSTTGISGWVTGDGIGVVVPPGDPPALAAAINDVLSGRWHPDADGASAFVEPFTAPVVAAQLVEIYRSVAGANATENLGRRPLD